jgi:putative radical SAM enzyme (TIGR03279 family)
MDKILISGVKNNSIAEEVEIESGDSLLSINGSLVNDIIEYKYLITAEKLDIVIEKSNNEIWEIEIDKEYDEDLGLIFKNAIIDQAKGCQNKCIFCFIDQLPKGLRKTLYFKDDDTRLSFLQGNYVTLTNMKEEEIERIIKYRINPINISVHTTNPDLRKRMLNNKNAGKLMETIKRFADEQLIMNAQIVLCPDVNDRDELNKSLRDLSNLYPYVKSVTIVPVGISKHRQKLFPMREFTKKETQIILKQISDFQNKMLKMHSTRFVFPADEFIIRSETNFPDTNYYEGFEQLENGVGMVTLLKDQLNESLKSINEFPNSNKFSIITGKLAYPYIKELMDRVVDKWNHLNIQVYGVKNDFFGEKITVSGLVTGQDIINQLKDKDLGNYVLIPKSMLKADENIFLDDYTVEQVANSLNTPVYPVEVEGEILINKILSINT